VVAKTFVVVTAFATYTFPGMEADPSGLKYHRDEREGVATLMFTPPEFTFTSDRLPDPSFQSHVNPDGD
jgi:hypothetical protein